MKASGKRRKGSRLERKVATLIRQKGLDDNCKRMVLSGADWAFRGDINTKLPYTIECKNQETVRLWEWWQQARDQGTFQRPPVLMVGGNYRPILAIMDINDWLNLVKGVNKNV